MANPTVLQKKNGPHLWVALIGLGFQPDAAASSISKTKTKHLNLGPNMFDKPNKDAFYIVTRFLLEKLNPTRLNDAYRHCWPVWSHKEDAEFRKVTCTWLREIMDETSNAGSKVVASLFMSPGGPKFIDLMLHLADHVMLQEIKTFTTSDGWVPEAAAMPASTFDLAVKRFNLVRKRFLKTAVDQDQFLHKYQRRAQQLVQSKRDSKAEVAKYDELLKRFTPDSTQDDASLSERIKKVRTLWFDIEKMLSAIKEEQNAVKSVLKGDEDQFVLDGTDQVFKIPRCLLERIEQLPHQLNSGNVYEAGQLNLLCVMELMNHALQLLKRECSRVPPVSKSQIRPQNLQERRLQMSQVLRDLHLIRQNISKEEIPEVRSTIRELEANWDEKWKDILKETPLFSFLSEDPALGFLSPMAPLSFEPASEVTYRSSVFSQYPAKLPVLDENPAKSESEEDMITSNLDTRSFPTTTKTFEVPPVIARNSQANTSLDWLFDTPPSPPQKAPLVKPLQASVGEMTHQMIAPLKTKSQILNLEYENLADLFADAVTTTSPSEGQVKALDLESLLSTYERDPFSARKQLPRTPESLILDVKSSWRKAVEEDEAKTSSQSSELNDITKLLNQSQNISCDPPSQTASCSAVPHDTDQDSPSAFQQVVASKCSLLWDTFNIEVPDSPSGTNSIAVQFSLENETLPEMPSCDSLCLEDEAVGLKSEKDEEILITSLQLKQSVLPTPHRDQNHQASNGGSLVENRSMNLLSDSRNKDWLIKPGASVESTMFSLELDSLEPPSPRKKQEYSLPKLITFSPMDDMKC